MCEVFEKNGNPIRHLVAMCIAIDLLEKRIQSLPPELQEKMLGHVLTEMIQRKRLSR